MRAAVEHNRESFWLALCLCKGGWLLGCVSKTDFGIFIVSPPHFVQLVKRSKRTNFLRNPKCVTTRPRHGDFHSYNTPSRSSLLHMSHNYCYLLGRICTQIVAQSIIHTLYAVTTIAYSSLVTSQPYPRIDFLDVERPKLSKTLCGVFRRQDGPSRFGWLSRCPGTSSGGAKTPGTGRIGLDQGSCHRS